MEVLSHDVVETILERVPVKSLLRFKSVSKQWKSTIESKNFQERQLIHRQQSPDPNVLFLTFRDPDCDYDDDDTEDIPSSFSFSVDDNDDDDHIKIISSSPVTSIKVHIRKWIRCSTSCDGLVCICNEYESIMINPTTRWHRTIPLSNLQKRYQFGLGKLGFRHLGFGKDKFNGTYKSVLLYSNSRIYNNNKEAITTCEVFDFRNNAWRYVTCPAPPCDIIAYVDPVHLEGSLHWLTKCELDTQVLSFDLHTETFQVIAKAPFDRAARHHYQICNLNNRLCVSETNWPNQVIWLFDSGSKTWNHMCSIDLKITYSWFRKSTKYEIQGIGNCIGSLSPLAVLEEKNEKTKVLFYFSIDEESGTYFVIYDGQTEFFDFAFAFNSLENYLDPICYFQSLISIL